MLINQHSLVLIMGSLQFFRTLRKLTIEKQTVVSMKRDLPQFVLGNINKTRGQNGNQGQPKLIMQTYTSGLRPRHRFVRCLRSLWSTWPRNNRTNLYNFRFVLMLVCLSPQIFCHRPARSTSKLDFLFSNFGFRVLHSQKCYVIFQLAFSAGVFFDSAICPRKRHVETSRREEEMG